MKGMRIFRTAAALIYSAGICTKAAAKSVSGDRIAVILDAGTPQEEYSHFFEALRSKLPGSYSESELG